MFFIVLFKSVFLQILFSFAFVCLDFENPQRQAHMLFKCVRCSFHYESCSVAICGIVPVLALWEHCNRMCILLQWMLSQGSFPFFWDREKTRKWSLTNYNCSNITNKRYNSKRKSISIWRSVPLGSSDSWCKLLKETMALPQKCKTSKYTVDSQWKQENITQFKIIIFCPHHFKTEKQSSKLAPSGSKPTCASFKDLSEMCIWSRQKHLLAFCWRLSPTKGQQMFLSEPDAHSKHGYFLFWTQEPYFGHDFGWAFTATTKRLNSLKKNWKTVTISVLLLLLWLWHLVKVHRTGMKVLSSSTKHQRSHLQSKFEKGNANVCVTGSLKAKQRRKSTQH